MNETLFALRANVGRISNAISRTRVAGCAGWPHHGGGRIRANRHARAVVKLRKAIDVDYSVEFIPMRHGVEYISLAEDGMIWESINYVREDKHSPTEVTSVNIRN